ncbi:MAG: glycosyltransferase [Candidatus Binataceae bacterium]
MIRVSLVNGIFYLPDAISYSLDCKVRALRELFGEKLDYRVYATGTNQTDSNIRTVGSVAELARDPFLINSDLVCYEFGIYYELFNSIFLLPRRCRKLAVYHNITPEALLAAEDQKLAVRHALQQKANLLHCDLVLTDSDYNRQDLIEFGVSEPQVEVLGLPLPPGFSSNRTELLRVDGSVELLFVGRLVPSKGIIDIITAVTQLLRAGNRRLHLSIVGDERFADPAYVAEIRRAIGESGFGAHFRLVGSVNAKELVRYYENAHIVIIPSYHEGYCLPVIEAMATGCLVVAYDAGNLPHIVNGLGRIVPTGNIRNLANTIAELANALIQSTTAPDQDLLPIDRATMTIDCYLKEVANYLESFTSARYRENLKEILVRMRLLSFKRSVLSDPYRRTASESPSL